MTTVKEIAFKYAAKGADAARRADRRVRDSVNDTAKTAQRESGTIGRWMERHRSAVQMIGVATLGVMGAIISASPTMRAELAGVRIAFSLWADTIANDVLPEGWSLADLAFELEEIYSDLPTPVRETASALFLFGGAAIFAATGAAALAGPLATLARWAGVVGGVLSGGVGLGILIGLAGVAALEITGVTDRIRDLGRQIGERLPEWARDGLISLIGIFSWPLAVIGGFITGFVRGTLEEGLIGGIRQGVSDARDVLETFLEAWDRTLDRIIDAIGDLIDRAKSWGSDIISELIDGIRSRIPDLQRAVDRVRQTIESRLSFDIVANDRAARRWGSDLLEEMSTGMRSAQPEFERAIQSPIPSGSGGSGGRSVTIGEINVEVDGAGSPRRTAERTADEVSQTIQDDFGARR